MRDDAQIENEFFLVMVDPDTGSIRSLVDKRSGSEYAEGLLNHVLALDEDEEKTRGGKDFWTQGTWDEPGAIEEVHTEVAEWMQRITVASPFAGGRLVRTLCLYRGVPRVVCETRLEGVDLAGRAIAAVFEPGAEGRAPVFGERSGAVVGRQSRGSFDFRTRGMENLSGTGVQPALGWAALSPNDAIQAGPRGAIPLGPATIIHGEARALKNAALAVQQALAHRGIPAIVLPDEVRKPGALWSDSTEYPSVASSLDAGRAMHVVIGSPSQNRYCGEVVKNLNADEAALLEERLAQGAVLFVENHEVQEGYPAIPTLLFAGAIPGRSAELAEEFASNVDARGTYSLPPSAYLAGDTSRRRETGLGVLFPGAHAASFEADGSLALIFAHGGGVFEEGGLVTAPTEHVFQYALAPFDGDWRMRNCRSRAGSRSIRCLPSRRPCILAPTPGRLG